MHDEADNADSENVGAGVALGAVLQILAEVAGESQNNLVASAALKKVEKKVRAMRLLAEKGKFVQGALAPK
ncbi:MAG: hypothetical protein Q7S10_01055 [bacterium]|nr:hypothetical protein [bacterium]